MANDDYPIAHYPSTSRETQSLWIWATLLFAAFVLCCALAAADTTVGPLDPATGTWRVYRGNGYTTFVCSANSEAAALTCAAADAERRKATTRYQLRYPNRYGMVSYFAPTPAPVDCVVSDWSNWVAEGTWSACTEGSQTLRETHTRTVATQPANGGAACPVLVETRISSRACTLPSTVSLRWSTPPSPVPIDNYTVVYGRLPTELVNSSQVAASAASFDVEGLDDGTWSFAVIARGGGNQAQSNTITVQVPQTLTAQITWPAPVPSVTKWATPNGSATSDCSQALPCTLVRALRIAVAGDTVSIAAGVHTASCVADSHDRRFTPAFNPTGKGTKATPIALVGAGSATQLRAIGGCATWGAYNTEWISWRGVSVVEADSPSVPDTGPVVVWRSKNITIKDSFITGGRLPREDNYTGIRLEQVDGVTLEGNEITGIGHSPDASQNFAAIEGYNAVNVIVRRNRIRNSDVGIFPKGARQEGIVALANWLIVDNDIRGTRWACIHAGGLGTGSGYPRSRIANNLCVGQGGEVGIHLHTYDAVSPRDIDVWANTITGYKVGVYGYSQSAPAGQSQTNISIRDNILDATYGVSTSWTTSRAGFVSDYNLLGGANAGHRDGYPGEGGTVYRTLSSWRATGWDTHSIAGPALLDASYKLPAGHPGQTAASDGGALGAR